MIYRFTESEKRRIDDNLEIIDLFTQNDAPLDFVIAELDGFHGTFVNSKNDKFYFIIAGEAAVTIDGETTQVFASDFIVVKKNTKHSIEGKVKFVVMCTPPYDFNSEIVI